jgi:hypothetical protein
MKYTGYRLQGMIRDAVSARDSAALLFPESIYAFPGTDPSSPVATANALAEADREVARLQVLQARYNLAVKVRFDGATISLHEVVKLVGGLGRLEKLWRNAARLGTATTDRYDRRPLTRAAGETVAVRQVSIEECSRRAIEAAKLAAAAREAIQLGNATEIELD